MGGFGGFMYRVRNFCVGLGFEVLDLRIWEKEFGRRNY